MYTEQQKDVLVQELKNGYRNNEYTNIEIVLTVIMLYKKQDIVKEDIFIILKKIFDTSAELLSALRTALPALEDDTLIVGLFNDLKNMTD
ncbi:MAG: hypothetical protein MJB12_17610 [Firmicutes bacterium]|nr:hypothetical protein [Bacillota bacterium]